MMVVWSAVSVATVVWLGRSTRTEATMTAATAAAASTQPRLYQTGLHRRLGDDPLEGERIVRQGRPAVPSVRGLVGHARLGSRPAAEAATPRAKVWMVAGSRL